MLAERYKEPILHRKIRDSLDLFLDAQYVLHDLSQYINYLGREFNEQYTNVSNPPKSELEIAEWNVNACINKSISKISSFSQFELLNEYADIIQRLNQLEDIERNHVYD